MTRVLVTGSTGFIGSNLSAALIEHGVDVVGLRRSNSPGDAAQGLDISFVTGNILFPESLPLVMKGIDWVFHVAAIANYWQFPAETVHRVNVEGTRNVLQAARQAGVKRVVITGSSTSLGIPREGRPLLDEGDRFNLKPHLFPYGYSKYLVDQMMTEFVRHGLEVVSVLPSTAIGPRDLKFNTGEIVVQVLKSPSPRLFVPCGGLNLIDVRDCVDAHITAAKRGKPGERYLLTGHNMTHVEVVQHVSRALGVSAEIVEVPGWALVLKAGLIWSAHRLGLNLPADCGRVLLSHKHLYYNNQKAVNELGLKNRPFEESVRDTYEWYIQNNYLQKWGIRTARVSPA
ncbi:MAG: NAD-dependent epimerase/dehydratase family protein [Anaerolineae bacterium]|nr:NAD-dependent epimerase/dehydratase family protein [Anaerolineae bacterium]